jgi:hypothetical protein
MLFRCCWIALYNPQCTAHTHTDSRAAPNLQGSTKPLRTNLTVSFLRMMQLMMRCLMLLVVLVAAMGFQLPAGPQLPKISVSWPSQQKEALQQQEQQQQERDKLIEMISKG